MESDRGIFLGLGEHPVHLNLRYANRHGLIAGATGTGKTVTLQSLAEGFSAAGVPVFLADVKGDLGGLAAVGEGPKPLDERARAIGLEPYERRAFPVCFWDLFGEKGARIRTTPTEMGPLLLSRLMGLSEAQEGALTLAFRVADDEGLPVLDLKDLRKLLTEIGERAPEFSTTYGHVTKATIGAIQRRLLSLEEQGGALFFGEPALAVSDLIRTDAKGCGIINVLASDRLIQAPQLYATFLLWILSELFEELPEIGDVELPRLVFFFDEAHLLFDKAPKAVRDKIEQVVRLIRSRGVGVYFVTQSPSDIPDAVSAQLGCRILHALRGFTPADQKVIKAAAAGFRPNPSFDTATAIPDLKIGEALVSLLEDKGAPSPVQRTLIRPPASKLGVIHDPERARIVAVSQMTLRYAKDVDRDSAFEMLARREAERARHAPPSTASSKSATKPRASSRQTHVEAATKSFIRSLSSGLGRELLRGVLGNRRR